MNSITIMTMRDNVLAPDTTSQNITPADIIITRAQQYDHQS